jgi:hypothetical protein
LFALGLFIAGALGSGAQSPDAGALTGVEVAEGRNEAGMREPVGSRLCMMLGSGRRDVGRIDSAAIVGNVVSPMKDGVLPD